MKNPRFTRGWLLQRFNILLKTEARYILLETGALLLRMEDIAGCVIDVVKRGSWKICGQRGNWHGKRGTNGGSEGFWLQAECLATQKAAGISGSLAVPSKHGVSAPLLKARDYGASTTGSLLKALKGP